MLTKSLKTFIDLFVKAFWIWKNSWSFCDFCRAYLMRRRRDLSSSWSVSLNFGFSEIGLVTEKALSAAETVELRCFVAAAWWFDIC